MIEVRGFSYTMQAHRTCGGRHFVAVAPGEIRL